MHVFPTVFVVQLFACFHENEKTDTVLIQINGEKCELLTFTSLDIIILQQVHSCAHCTIFPYTVLMIME